jgi:hypothetical protein
MDNLLSDSEREDLINKLNTCYNQYSQWERRKAQKMHTDIFGVEIREGDYYYRIHLDADFKSDLKLSINSMDKFLYAIFAPFPNWEGVAEDLIKERFEKTRELIDNLYNLSRKLK